MALSIEALDEHFCLALIRAEQKAHEAVNRPIHDRRSVRAVVRRRFEAKAMAGKTVAELIYAKKAEGVRPAGVSAMRTLMHIYPDHSSPMWLALVESDALHLSLEGVMLEQQYRPLFESVPDGRELLLWAKEGSAVLAP